MSNQSAIHPFLAGGPKQLFIGGQFVEAQSGETFEVVNPSTGKVIAEVAKGAAADVDRARD